MRNVFAIDFALIGICFALWIIWAKQNIRTLYEPSDAQIFNTLQYSKESPFTILCSLVSSEKS